MTGPNENPPPSVATPEARSQEPEASASPAAPPPAAALVRDGLADAELLAARRELEAERKARADAEQGRRAAETRAAEQERRAQELKALQEAAPTPAPPKAKRKFATLMNHPWS